MIQYHVSEIFGPTIQGEGLHAGLPCVFLRLSGCNLWTNASVPSKTCPWCDTPQLFNRREMTAKEICAELAKLMKREKHFGLVISGGEPLLQLDDDLLDALYDLEFPWIDVETNGTVPAKFLMPIGVELSLSCSPKTKKVVVQPSWFKILVPDKLPLLNDLRKEFPRVPIYLQPIEPREGIHSNAYARNAQKAVALAIEFGYRVCIQQHKYLGTK